MKPVAIFRHARSEGPGYFATFLDENNIPWRLLAIDEGEPVPQDAQAFSGLVFMGGPMSVNDDLPWIPPVLALIRQAAATGIPVLGHCLGGQLMDYESADNHQNNLEAVEYLEWMTTSLHDAVMKVRMVPVERVFNRFPRMVRDLAKDLGKNIKLNMSGEETEVDRTVIDEIGDPLIHLIRNSIDHGIESPAERSDKGKTEYGTVSLRAYPDGNTVVIEVEDDGNGINVERVAQKAVEKGVVTREEVEAMSQQQS